MNLITRLWYLLRLRRSFYRWDRQAIKNHQQKQLTELISFVRANSSYYQRILQSSKFEDIPIIDKKTMMDNFNEINTQNLDRDEIFDFRINQEKQNIIGLYEHSGQQYSIGLSSGTSGNKGLTVLSKEEMQKYSLVLFLRNGVPPGVRRKRVLFTLRVNNPSFMEVGRFGFKIVYSDYTKSAKELVEKINQHGLNIIAGPPSMLSLIAKEVDMINHSIDCIISYAEVLYPEVKTKLENAFACPVAQIYQGSEGFIASTCKHNQLHVNEDLIYLELEQIKGEEPQRVIVTDLFRQTQPIIRYALNDIIELRDSDCACGSTFRIVERIHGRSDDIFHIKDAEGTKLHLFPDYVRRSIVTASDMVSNYQAIQHQTGMIEIRLQLTGGADIDAIAHEIRQNLQVYADRMSGIMPELQFNQKAPEKHPVSKKLIRIMRIR